MGTWMVEARYIYVRPSNPCTLADVQIASYLPCRWQKVGLASSQCTSPQLYPQTPGGAHMLCHPQIPQAKWIHLEYYASAKKREGNGISDDFLHATIITECVKCNYLRVI